MHLTYASLLLPNIQYCLLFNNPLKSFLQLDIVKFSVVSIYTNFWDNEILPLMMHSTETSSVTPDV